MTSAPDDQEAAAAYDPRTSARQLADLAARRWDLHPVIAVHPRAYPALRAWIAQASMQQQSATVQPPPRRRTTGCWFAGCGCLSVATLLVLFVFLLGGSLLSVPGGPAGSGEQAASSDRGSFEENMAAYDVERAKHQELAAQLVGNPVAPLVTDRTSVVLLEKQAAEVRTHPLEEVRVSVSASLATEMKTLRLALEQRIADAEGRRANATGTLAETLVDAAGNGFIDIARDAATACSLSEEASRTTAGCTSDDPPTIHILPEEQLTDDWHRQVLVLHELAHLYQRADLDLRPLREPSRAQTLVEQGLFEGSSEKMADCYALTYLDSWTLENEHVVIGYGYVCDASERQAIREWAAEIHAPMP